MIFFFSSWLEYSHAFVHLYTCYYILIFVTVLTQLWNILGFHLLASRGPLKTLSGHIWFLVNISDLDKKQNQVLGLTIKMVSECLSAMRLIQTNETLHGYPAHLPLPHLKTRFCCNINLFSALITFLPVNSCRGSPKLHLGMGKKNT